MKRKMISLLLAAALVVGICPVAFAAEGQPRYAITDDVVIIDYAEYEIINGKIQYNGWTYDVDGNVLVRYDAEGPIYLVLPTEQNRITNSERIAELNAAIGKEDPLGRAVPSNPVNLPYTANVARGTITTISPAFKIVPSRFYNYINCRLTNFSTPVNKTYYIIFSSCDVTGTWTEYQTRWDFGGRDFVRFDVYSSMQYGLFAITNLYDDPAPSYTYEIFLSAV